MELPIRWLMKRVAQVVSPEEHARIVQELSEYQKQHMFYSLCRKLEGIIKNWKAELNTTVPDSYKTRLRSNIAGMENRLEHLRAHPEEFFNEC